MNRLFRCLITVGLCLASAAQALAWNKPGHMVVAAIAYQDLVRSGDTLVIQKAIALLKAHPYYTDNWVTKLQTQSLGPAEHDQFVFMYAARWPDDARGTSYHREKWHFINLPYKPAGQPSSVVAVNPPAENIVNAITNMTKLVSRANASRVDRAVGLAWLFHLYGDIHQPLHTSALFTVDYPRGDRGGTLFYIRRSANSEGTLSLHTYWDGLITTSERFTTIKNEATGLLARPNLKRSAFPQLGEIVPARWAMNESLPLARTVAYRNGQLDGSTDEEHGEPLPSDYPAQAKDVAEMQVTLAGYRLADFLRKLFQ